MRALRANALTIAKNAFARLKEVKFLSLIEAIEKNTGAGAKAGEAKEGSATTFSVGVAGDKRNRHRNVAPAQASMSIAAASMGNNEKILPLDATWLAEILAYDGHHHEAAKTYARAGKIDEAIRLFIDLRRWDDAKMFSQSAGRNDQAALAMQQAKWLQEVNDWKGAAELFVSLGQHQQAAKTVVDAQGYGWPAVLIDVVRATPSDSQDVLQFCGDQLAAADEDVFAREAYKKAGEVTKLMSLYARKQMWVEAAALAEQHEGEFDVSVFLPYAEWLVMRDRFQEAMEAYKRAGRRDLSRKVLMELTHNAVLECRFKDAAYYYWVLAKDAESDESGSATTQMQHEWEHKADLYFAYSTIHAFVTDPFTSHQPETLFQVSRFIVNSLGTAEIIPSGISKAATLYTLAREAMHLGCFKLARHAYDRLGKLRLAGKKQDEVELDMLIVQAKPVRDDPDHLPVCYRCGATNPLLNPFSNKFSKGDVCTSCGHPFVRSFINFDVLPLVEFVPEPSISDEEAVELIRQTQTAADGRRAPADRCEMYILYTHACMHSV
jgi:intraflagellar transport protein 122